MSIRGFPFIKRLLILLAVCYTVLFVFACSFADRLIFLPHRSSYQDSPEILKLPTADGEKIAAVYLPNPKAKFTLLYSHGNGEDIGDDMPLFREYQRRGFSVFGYDYHGYGLSTGNPSERAAYADIDAAYEHLTKQLHIPPERIIAHGHSLGTGVSVDLAARKPVGGLILESPFVTAFRVRTHWPLLPGDQFRSIDKIRSVRCPILVIHGTDDWVVRNWHGQAIFKRANEPKFSYWIKDAGHNDLVEVGGEEYWRTLEKFAQFLETRQ